MKYALLTILDANGIDPTLKIGEQTAYELLEAAVMGALDEIEENIND